MDSTPKVIQADVAQAYAALARRVTAIDMALKCGLGPNTLNLIRAEVEEAMEVIHCYENPFLAVPSFRS
jgi:hypothetical protein